MNHLLLIYLALVLGSFLLFMRLEKSIMSTDIGDRITPFAYAIIAAISSILLVGIIITIIICVKKVMRGWKLFWVVLYARFLLWNIKRKIKN